MSKILGTTIIVIGSLVLSACSIHDTYRSTCEVPEKGWTKYDTIVFEPYIKDTISTYSVVLTVRHTNVYPYQNMWLFINDMDSIEFYLCNQRGYWTGMHTGRFFEIPIQLYTHYQFPHKGNYQFRIVQGMRDEVLQGVSDIGLSIEKEIYGEE